MRIFLAILGCLWLNAEAIKVGVKLETPFVMEKADGGYEGFIVDLVNKLGELAGDNVTLVVSEQTVYGGFDESGNITGLLGELEDGEYDMAAGPITITEARANFVDFSDGFWSTGLTMVTARPQRRTSAAGKMFIYFRPFSAAVWFVIILCSIIAAVLHYVMNKFHPKDAGLVSIAGEALKKPTMYSEGRRFADACWWICRSFNLQGAESRPKSIAGRVVLVVWIMFVLDTLFLYLATLVNNIPLYYPTPAQQAELATQVPALPFTTIDDIYLQDHCQFGTVTDTAITSFFAASTAESLVAVNGALDNVACLSDGIARVNGGRYVMFMDDCLAQYYANTDCDVVTVGGVYETYDYGFAFPMGSQLKNPVNGFLAQLKDAAKTSHSIWWNVNTLECKPYVPPASPVNTPMPYKIEMDSYGGPVVLFIIGQLIALLVALIEVLVIKRRTRTYDVEGAKDAESTPMLEAEESQAVKYEADGKDKEEKDEEAKDTEDVKEGDDDSVKKEKEAANADDEKKDDDKEIKEEGNDEKDKSSQTEGELKDNKDIVGADDVKDKDEEKEGAKKPDEA